MFNKESWHNLPIYLSFQIAADCISEYLNFQNFPGGPVPGPASMSHLGLFLCVQTRPYCISPQYAPPRITNKNFQGTPLTSLAFEKYKRMLCNQFRFFWCKIFVLWKSKFSTQCLVDSVLIILRPRKGLNLLRQKVQVINSTMKLSGLIFYEKTPKHFKARFRCWTFLKPNLILIKADPNYFDPAELIQMPIIIPAN